MSRSVFYWLPTTLGALGFGALLFRTTPLATAAILAPFLLHTGLALLGRAPHWLTRFLLGVLAFAGCFGAAYAASSLFFGDTLATEQLFVAFLIGAPFSSAWRFAYIRRPMGPMDRRLPNAAALLLLICGVASLF